MSPCQVPLIALLRPVRVAQEVWVMLTVEVVMRRDEHGMWFAETPFLGLTGDLGHQGLNPFLNTPWAALASLLRCWDYWRPGGGHDQRYEAWKQSGDPCPRCEATGVIESIDGTTIPCTWCVGAARAAQEG